MKIHNLVAILGVIAGAMAVPNAFAQTTTQTGPVTITTVASSWNDDSILVNTVEPLLGTAAICPNRDGYISSATDPARKAIQTIALAALLADKKVLITTDGTCVFGRPRLLSVSIQK
jgi:hypothetical protein